jgi:hypothetical protein
VSAVSGSYLPLASGVAVIGNHVLRLLFSDGAVGDAGRRDRVPRLASPRSVAINGDAVACGGGAPRSIYY